MDKKFYLTIYIFLAFIFPVSFYSGNAFAAVIASHHNTTFALAGPTISESGTPGYLSTTYGAASGSTSFTVSGSNLTAGITVAPPPGFVVSLNNSSFTPTLTIGTGGNIPNTTVYMRLAATTAAGNYSGNIVLSSSGASNVNVPVTTSTVNKAPLTITPKDATKTYGTVLTSGPGYTAFTTSGLQNGESITSVSVSYGPGAQATDGVGTYGSCLSIGSAVGSNFSANNYNINYAGANIIVNPAPLTIKANDVTKTYGTTITGGSGSTAFTSAGLKNGEAIGSVTIGYGTGSAATDPVATYTDCVTIAAATGGTFSQNNYTITYVPANIIVTRAKLTVTADDVTKTYGVQLQGGPGYTSFTSNGLLNGETIGTVTIGYGTGGAANAHVGRCRNCVTVAAATGGTFNPFNYQITYVPGSITIVPAPLTIIADDKIKLYGEDNPPFTATYSGLLNGDTPGQLYTQPTFQTPATDTSVPGDYPITASGASSADYTITYVPGKLTITDSYGIPNTFTPNGDGINDTWHIKFLDSYHRSTVTIFNRNGQNIYYSNGYGIPWDGTYKGSPLPTGVYYYVINLVNISKLLSGYITIIR